MQFTTVSAVFTALFITVLGWPEPHNPWPQAPLSTSGRWIINSAGEKVIYAGVNWPGAADTMIPEGLQYASIPSIVSKIKSLGMNVIRLTYAIELIDDIYETGADVPIKASFITALGTENGTAVFNAVLKHNPSFTAKTTRLQVYDAIAAECFKNQIYVHLDNHVSKAEWCCANNDGNAWFGDTYFNVTNWKRGLAYMARHGHSWGNLVSMGMRNELREPTDDPILDASSYNWHDWYINMVAAANTIHAVNPDVLTFFSGLNFDTDLSPIPTGANLGGGLVFRKSDFVFENKLVLELHNYQNNATSCDSMKQSLVEGGFDALETRNSSIVNVLPMVLTEFGYAQDNTTYQDVYATCLKSYLPEVHVGWMVWVLAGSYYIRQGVQDSDETWGLLNHKWTAWRSIESVENGIIPMVKATLDG